MALKRKIKASGAEGGAVTIGEAFARFTREKEAKGVVEKTLKNYKQSLNYLLDAYTLDDDANITVITKEMLTDWILDMQERELTAAAINHYLRDIRAFLYWCMADERKYIERYKVETVRAQEPTKKIYAQDDIKKLLAKPKERTTLDFVEWRNWLIVNLALDMGARAGSLLEIRVGDINFKKNTIYLRHTKNKAVAHPNISSACAKALKDYISLYLADAEQEDYLLCNIEGEQLTYNALAHSFTKYCKKRKVQQYSIHGLRHTFATELAENTGGDMIRVQKALGHSSIDMARKYVDMAAVDMGDYDEISPLAKSKGNRGRPRRKIGR